MDELLSTCCTAPSDTEIFDGQGICSACKEHATFICGNCPDDAEECICERDYLLFEMGEE